MNINVSRPTFTALASEMVKMYGKKLIGRTVDTMQIGEWPGGLAIVTQVGHDKGAPEIVFLVKHTDPKYAEKFGEMGVFHDESVSLK